MVTDSFTSKQNCIMDLFEIIQLIQQFYSSKRNWKTILGSLVYNITLFIMLDTYINEKYLHQLPSFSLNPVSK